MIRKESQRLDRVLDGMATGIISKNQCKREFGEFTRLINIRKDDSNNISRTGINARLFAAIYENFPHFTTIKMQ